MCVCLVIVLGCAIIVTVPILTSARVNQPEVVKSLSDPLTQIANVVVHNEK